MQAINRQFVEIINGNKQFIIPVFQRDYSWTTEQCRQLWADIMRASNGDDGGHFLGSFVYVEGSVGAAFSSWLVIDGQQRLTTLTLLLIALRDYIQETHWVGEDPTPKQIDAYFLKNEHETGNRSYKLVLRRHDDETLRALVDGNDLFEAEKNSPLVVDAYNYFKELLNSPETDPAKVYRGIARLNIVDVKLERRSDNPQLVFESLNSTGVDLTESDLIRNYLLMGLPEADQTRLYNDYWSKLKNDFRRAGSVFDSFLRDYIALKQKSTIQTRADKVYDEFKKFWPSSDTESTAELLADMVRFARYYASFLHPSMIQDKPIVTPMTNLHSGGFGNTHAPLIMRLYDCYERNLLTESNFIQALVLIKSYLLRRAVLGLQTRAYWSIFARIAHSINDESPFESFQVALARQNYSYRFPSDKEFITTIQEYDLYRLRICFHILECLENSGQRELSPTQGYTVEHIMPQNIDNVLEWQQMLGDDWEDTHGTWLHRLGNLTLTAYNNEYSNKPFNEKKSTSGGFNQSAVRLNQYVRAQERWTIDEMAERGRVLANRTVKIWPNHKADEKLIRNEDIRDLRARAAERNSDSLVMDTSVRELLHTIQDSIRGMGDSIEVIENRSICYYDYSTNFFAEILPMVSYVRLLIPLDFDEIDDPEGLAADVNAWKFLTHVTHRDCGVFIDIREKQQIAAAMSMIRQAFNMAAD